MSILSAKYFHDEKAAYEFVESKLWPKGEQVCPHCGVIVKHYRLKGDSTRHGVYKCKDCRKPFTVKVGTIFEASHVPMHLWLQAIYLVASSKKGISANQLHRTLGVTLKTAWFMGHRIREAMKDPGVSQLGGIGKVVEMDDTAIGGKEKNRHASKRKRLGTGYAGKEAVFSLVERNGEVRSCHIPKVNSENLRPIIKAQINVQTKIASDDASANKIAAVEAGFVDHETVNHRSHEYVRGTVHSNTVENYFSILKRGISGCYFHVSEEHLHRYLAEFDFRYSNRVKLGIDDQQRSDRILGGVIGKRLTYQRSAN